MMIRVNGAAKIENPRKYEPRAVEHLRVLLETGSRAQPDLHRQNFYEIEDGSDVYYIHISPINGTVVLVAKWIGQPLGCCHTSSHLVA